MVRQALINTYVMKLFYIYRDVVITVKCKLHYYDTL